jgi:hypothetical protein
MIQDHPIASMRQNYNALDTQNLVDNGMQTPQYLKSVMLLAGNVGSHR